MKCLSLLTASLLALGLTSCDSGSGASTNTGTNGYTDVKPANLTKDDKAFMARLAGVSASVVRLSPTSQGATTSSKVAARRYASSDSACTSPRILHDTIWRRNDSTVDSGAGAIRVVIDDTTTIYDDASGKDITCDLAAMTIGLRTRNVFRQSNVHGDLMTSFNTGTYLSRMDTATRTWELSMSVKGRVRYTDGFTLLIDSAAYHHWINLDDRSATPKMPSDLYYHLRFESYPYAATLRSNAAADAITGDIVRGNERIGIMTVFGDNTMKVVDLDGNAIKP